MPRAFLKTKIRAGREYKCEKCGKVIEPGTKYYTWKFNFGAQHIQCTDHGAPRPSQLTNSKMGEVWDAQADFDLGDATCADDIEASLASVAEAARSVSEQYGEAADNIESSFPSGNPTSEACRTASDDLESWADELERWQPEDDDEPEDEDEKEEWLEAMRGSAQDLVDNAPEYQG